MIMHDRYQPIPYLVEIQRRIADKKAEKINERILTGEIRFVDEIG